MKITLKFTRDWIRREVNVSINLEDPNNELMPRTFLMHISNIVRRQCTESTGFEDIINLWVTELNKVKNTYADVAVEVNNESIELVIPDHLYTLSELQYS